MTNALNKLKPLANLAEIRAAAIKEAGQAEKLITDFKGNYDSKVSEGVLSVRKSVNKEINECEEKFSKANNELKKAKDDADTAQAELEKSIAGFAKSQENSLGLPKQIQEQQKALAALEAEFRDAHTKHQLVEAVIKLDDLKQKLEDFKSLIQPECESYDWESKMWKGLKEAHEDLIKKTDALPTAKSLVPVKEAPYNMAKTAYEDAKKSWLDDITDEIIKLSRAVPTGLGFATRNYSPTRDGVDQLMHSAASQSF